MFKKYPSIENSYQKKTIEYFNERHPNLVFCWYIVQEKIHGCLREDTLIRTKEFGDVSIKFLVENKLKCNVLSFNTEDGEIEWDEIVDFSAIEDNEKEWYEVVLEDGTILNITGNHKVWIDSEKKYRSIEHLFKTEGDIFLMKNMNFVEVKSIKRIDKKFKSYDVETRKNHNFFANGVLVHNSNMQLIINPDGNIEAGSRNILLDSGDHFGFKHEIFESGKYDDLLNSFREMARNAGCIIHVYGEWFGKGIMKGVDYGKEKQIRFFDICFDGKLSTPAKMEEIFESYGISKYIIPTIDIVKGLDYALKVNVERTTMINPKEDNIMEGGVIKPYYMTFVDGNGNPFYLKKKNEKFLEKSQKRKSKKTTEELDPIVAEFKEEFGSYITEMRLQGIFSKYGMIEETSEIGRYIKYMLNDAWTDFMKDNDISGLDKKNIKEVRNFGKQIAKMLMKSL